MEKAYIAIKWSPAFQIATSFCGRLLAELIQYRLLSVIKKDTEEKYFFLEVDSEEILKGIQDKTFLKHDGIPEIVERENMFKGMSEKQIDNAYAPYYPDYPACKVEESRSSVVSSIVNRVRGGKMYALATDIDTASEEEVKCVVETMSGRTTTSTADFFSGTSSSGEIRYAYTLSSFLSLFFGLEELRNLAKRANKNKITVISISSREKNIGFFETYIEDGENAMTVVFNTPYLRSDDGNIDYHLFNLSSPLNVTTSFGYNSEIHCISNSVAVMENIVFCSQSHIRGIYPNFYKNCYAISSALKNRETVVGIKNSEEYKTALLSQYDKVVANIISLGSESRLNDLKETNKQLTDEKVNLIKELTRKIEEIKQNDQLIDIINNNPDGMADMIKAAVAEVQKWDQVAYVYFRHGKLNIRTNNMYCISDGFVYDIGEMKIEIDFKAKSVRWMNLTRRINGYAYNMSHPHVWSDGRACEGNFKTLAKKCFDANDIVGLAMLSINFIESVNTSDGAGRHIVRWPCVGKAKK